MSILDDTQDSNITMDEYDALHKLLRSPRCGILARHMCEAIADMDQDGASYLVSLIPGIVQVQSRRFSERIGNMRNFMYMLGRQLSCDRVASGSRKGKPAFLTANFSKSLGVSNWYVLAYIHDFANFKESARKVALDPGHYHQVTASRVCELDELSGCYVRQFRKILDDLETKDLEDLVSPSIFGCYGDMMELIDWCRENREVWDDIEE